jgi:hypothetical protein
MNGMPGMAVVPAAANPVEIIPASIQDNTSEAYEPPYFARQWLAYAIS